MTLSFLPGQESFAIEFDPAGAYSEMALDQVEKRQTGSRKAPLPAKHFFAEVRLNPHRKALLLRPQSRLTRFATDWILKPVEGKPSQFIYVVDYTDRLALNLYKLMGWDNRISYTVSGLIISPSFVAAMSDRPMMSDPAAATILVGDFFFNLRKAVLT